MAVSRYLFFHVRVVPSPLKRAVSGAIGAKELTVGLNLAAVGKAKPKDTAALVVTPSVV
jgi:hypothetical protein